MDKEAERFKNVETIETLEKLGEEKFCIDVPDKDARSRIETIFTSFRLLDRQHGLSWLTNDHKKTAVFHVLSAIRPELLCTHLEFEIELSHYDLSKEIKELMEHAIKLSEAFQLVENGAPSWLMKNGKRRSGKNREISDKGKGKKGKGKGNKPSNSDGRNLPICLYSPQKKKGSLHWLKECTACPEDENKLIFKCLANKKPSTRPSRSIHCQQRDSLAPKAKQEDMVSGCVNVITTKHFSSFEQISPDGDESNSAKRRADNGTN